MGHAMHTAPDIFGSLRETARQVCNYLFCSRRDRHRGCERFTANVGTFAEPIGQRTHHEAASISKRYACEAGVFTSTKLLKVNPAAVASTTSALAAGATASRKTI